MCSGPDSGGASRARSGPWDVCGWHSCDDQMDVQVPRHTGVEVAQKREEFLMAMSSATLADNGPGRHVQGGEQRGGAVAHIVMRHALDIAQPHGQDRLRAIQGLDLGFLIHAQHQRFGRRIEIEADNVPHFLHKEGIGGELEGALPMRLQPKGLPDAMHGGFRNPRRVLHRATAPLRAARGLRAQRLREQGGEVLVSPRAGTALAQLIMQTGHAILQKPLSPLAHGRLRHAQLVSDGRVASPRVRQQDDARPRRDPLRHRSRGEEALQLREFFCRQGQGRFRSSGFHQDTSWYEMSSGDARHIPLTSGTVH